MRNSKLDGHTDRITSIAFRRDGGQLATGSDDGTVIIWRLESGEHYILNSYSNEISSMTFKDGSHLIIGSKDHTIRILDIDNANCRLFENPFGDIKHIYYNDAKQQLECILENEKIGIWDLCSEEKYISDLPLKNRNIEKYKKNIVQVGSGSDAILLFLLDGEEHFIIDVLPEYLTCITYNSEKRQVVTGTCDGCVQIWDFDSGEEKKRYLLIPHINLYEANFELAIIDENDRDIYKMAGAIV